MCLLLVNHLNHPDYPLIVAANRDEFHQRPSAAAAWWEDLAHVVGGRDLEAGGTWLACDRRGRFATLTNVRSPDGGPPKARSRGLIVTDFLQSPKAPSDHLSELSQHGARYQGFNVLAYQPGELSWFSNQVGHVETLPAGTYTLSNAALDTVWPKTERLRDGFQRAMANVAKNPLDDLLTLLRDQTRADPESLPDTGIGRDMESVLSSIFIEGATYGTRCSTVILLDKNNVMTFHERRYDADGNVSGDSHVEFELASCTA